MDIKAYAMALPDTGYRQTIKEEDAVTLVRRPAPYPSAAGRCHRTGALFCNMLAELLHRRRGRPHQSWRMTLKPRTRFRQAIGMPELDSIPVPALHIVVL